MKLLGDFVLVIVLIVPAACAEEKDSDPISEGDELSGSWILVEHGYSPGRGYIVEEVPEKPAQIITLTAGKITTTMVGFKQLTHYEVLTDSTTNTPYMAFHSSDPNQESQNFSFSLTKTELKLYFRWCIEGCHLAFRKLE